MNYLTREKPVYDYYDITGFIGQATGCGCNECIEDYVKDTGYSIDDMCYMDETELNEVIK